METENEKKCLQLFRLQDNEEDQSYEWYKGQVEKRVEGTCQWFLEHDHYRQWLRQESGPLLVSADPGCGKSVLAKYLIDHELPRSSIICYFFFKDQVQNTLKQALCALLHQLFSAKPSLLHYAMPEYSRNGRHLVNNVDLLWDILCKAGKNLATGPSIFVLDALDECYESSFRDLVRMLKDYLQKGKRDPGKIKFLLTSRPYNQITSEFQGLVKAFPQIRIPGEEESERISQEVNYVVKCRVQQLAEEYEFTNDIESHLKQRLLEISHRTYLWVYLVFDYLKQGFKKTKKGIDTIISTLPESVNQAYEKILNRSKEEHRVRKVLSIILGAARPLTLQEMNVAVNIESSSKPVCIEDLDLEKENDFKHTLRNLCGLFISVYHSKVYFLHQTAREFLTPKLLVSDSVSSQALRWRGSINRQQAHSVLAETCMIYLNFRDFKNQFLTDQNWQKHTSDHYFLEYSVRNWATHLRNAFDKDQENLMPTTLKLCDPKMTDCKIWLRIYWRNNHFEDTPELTALMIVSYFGLRGAAERLLKKEADANIQDNEGQTALHWAARNGHEAVAGMLLEKGADVKILDNDGQTALH